MTRQPDPLFQPTDEAIQFHLHLARRFRHYAIGEPAGSDNWCVAKEELATAHRLIRRKRKLEAERAAA